MAEYDTWAPYYDVVFTGLEGEAEFYVGQALKRRQPVLELGCGTGRIAIPIAMSGVPVTAVDNSRPMLDELRAKAKAVGGIGKELTVVQDDMASLTKVTGQFPLVLMAYRTFMHLLTPDAQEACLETVRDRLTSDGLFIVNLWAARPAAIAPFLAAPGTVVHGGTYHVDDGAILHHCAAVYDEFAQRIVENHTIQELDEKGAVHAVTPLTMVRRWTYPSEMEHLVRRMGFDVVAVFGGFGLEPFTAASQEMIWVLRRAG